MPTTMRARQRFNINVEIVSDEPRLQKKKKVVIEPVTIEKFDKACGSKHHRNHVASFGNLRLYREFDCLLIAHPNLMMFEYRNY